MDIFAELGIDGYINAHDTYTVYGGSRMPPECFEAMRQVSQHFVDFAQLQRAVGEKIAQMTHNEAAYVTNGAAGALQLAAATCLAQGDLFRYMRLPRTSGADEIIVLHAQHNAYDAAILASGAKVVLVGDADETLESDLVGAITEKTAGVFYFINSQYRRASLSLEKTIEIAHARGVPVVVDAAAQLPPISNLWEIARKGAELVIFSGGKTLCGPQDSGLMVGKKEWIEDCHRFGAPAHGVCRACKTSRETVVGLWIALKKYMEMDHETHRRTLEIINRLIADVLTREGIMTHIMPYGPVGQTYPRLVVEMPQGYSAGEVAWHMLERRIYVGCDRAENSLYISPLNLSNEEAQTVASALVACFRGVEL